MSEQRTSKSPIDEAFLHDDDVTEVILVRHGQQVFPKGTEGATAGAFVDPPLSSIGVRQAVAVGEALANHRVDVVYSSQLQRAHVTGQQVAHHHGIEPIVDEAFQEFNLFGALPQGDPISDHVDPQQLIDAREKFVATRMWNTYPYAEDGVAFRRTVLGAFERVLDAHEGQHVVIACHGGVINAICGTALGHPEDMFFRPAHASIARLGVRGDRWVVRSLGETLHLYSVDPAIVTW